MREQSKNSAVEATLQLESERDQLKGHLYNVFSNLSSYLKGTYPGLTFERRRTYIGNRVARTTFQYANNWSDTDTVSRVINSINTRYRGMASAKISNDGQSVSVYLNS
jgi:hypothetical protein